MATPRYREDTKGNLKALTADCEAQMLCEIQHGDSWVFTAEDSDAWAEYEDYLTPAEMKAAFKRAQNKALTHIFPLED